MGVEFHDWYEFHPGEVVSKKRVDSKKKASLCPKPIFQPPTLSIILLDILYPSSHLSFWCLQSHSPLSTSFSFTLYSGPSCSIFNIFPDGWRQTSTQEETNESLIENRLLAL